MAYRYRPPSILSRLPRLSGYNAARRMDSLAARPLAAQVQQQAREEEPVFQTPVPEPPMRAAPVDAGVKLDPELAYEAALASDEVAAPGAIGPFGQQAMARQLPKVGDGLDLAGLAQMASQELGPPDIRGLAEEPLPISEGERAGRAMRAAVDESGLNPQSPDVKGVLPGIAQIGLRSIEQPRRTEAQDAESLAKAGRQKALADEAKARATDVPLEGESKRTRRATQNTRDWAEVTDIGRRATDRATNTATRRLLAALRGGEAELKAADELPGKAWFSSENPRQDARSGAAARISATASELRSQSGSLPVPPPPAAAPQDDRAAISAELAKMNPQQKAEAIEDARATVASPGPDDTPDDVEAARLFLEVAGVK